MPVCFYSVTEGVQHHTSLTHSQKIMKSRVQFRPEAEVGQPSRPPSGKMNNLVDALSLKAAKVKQQQMESRGVEYRCQRAGSLEVESGELKNLSLIHKLYQVYLETLKSSLRN